MNARLLLLGVVLAATPARAQFDKVYQWEVPPQGALEITAWTQYVPTSSVDYDRFGLDTSREDLGLYTVEVEYGLTDRFTAGAYVDAEDPHTSPLRYARARLVGRYAFFGKNERAFRPAVYVEFIQPRETTDEPSEVEARFIAERDVGDLRVDLNPIVSHATSGDAIRDGFEGSLAAGVYYRRYRSVQPGIEYFADIGPLASPDAVSEQRHILYPTLDVRPYRGLRWHVGVGFGLTGGSDAVTLRSILSYEFGTVSPANQRR